MRSTVFPKHPHTLFLCSYLFPAWWLAYFCGRPSSTSPTRCFPRSCSCSQERDEVCQAPSAKEGGRGMRKKPKRTGINRRTGVCLICLMSKNKTSWPFVCFPPSILRCTAVLACRESCDPLPIDRSAPSWLMMLGFGSCCLFFCPSFLGWVMTRLHTHRNAQEMRSKRLRRGLCCSHVMVRVWICGLGDCMPLWCLWGAGLETSMCSVRGVSMTSVFSTR